MPGPVFMRGESVTLHPVEEADLEFLQELVNRPDVRRGLGLAHPVSMADEREWFESDDDEDGVDLLICDGDDGVRVGIVSFSQVVERYGTAEAGYSVHPDHWGNGYAPDALARLVAYGFEERRLEKVWARAFASNDASQRVLEKVGFEHEATIPDQAFVDGSREDLERYGLLAADWRANATAGNGKEP